jgi:hypothetical protein
MTDALLKFGPDGLTVTVKDISNTGFATGLLKTTAGFIDYKQMVAPVKNMTKLLTFLKSVTGTIELDVIDNNLIIKSLDNDGRFKLAEEKFLECNLNNFPIFEQHDAGFEVDTKILDSAKKNASNLGFKHIFAEVKGGEFYLTAGEDEFDQLISHTKVDYKEVARTMYASVMLEFIAVIDGKAIITFNEDYPLLITVSSIDSTFKWVVAPMSKPKEDSETSS